MGTAVESWQAQAWLWPRRCPRQGSCWGPARVFLCRRGHPWQGSCRGSCGSPRLGSRRGLSSSGPHLILCIYDLHKDLHATMEVPPEPLPNAVDYVVSRGLKGGALHWCWASCPGKGLAGAAEAAPARALPGEPASSLCSLWSWPWRCLGCLVLRLFSGFPPLPC
jgi:hypothetical protein